MVGTSTNGRISFLMENRCKICVFFQSVFDVFGPAYTYYFSKTATAAAGL